jgi:hypothetical protein
MAAFWLRVQDCRLNVCDEPFALPVLESFYRRTAPVQRTLAGIVVAYAHLDNEPC